MSKTDIKKAQNGLKIFQNDFYKVRKRLKSGLKMARWHIGLIRGVNPNLSWAFTSMGKLENLGSKCVEMPLTDSSTCMKWKNSTSTEKQKSSSQFLLLHSGELRSLSKSIAIEFRHWNFRLAQKNSSFLRLLNHWTFQN